MALLSAILSNPPRPNQPLLLFQSSTAQSSLPILRKLIALNTDNNNSRGLGHTLLFCYLYPPTSLFDSASQTLQVFDRLTNVPGYTNNWIDTRQEILSTVAAAPSSGPLNVIIDSPDILSSDVGSVSQTYNFLRELMDLICSRSHPSRLILHLLSPSDLTALLVQPAFSSSLTQVIAHPPVLLTHLATAYFTPPPPASPPAKFWGIFLPFSERGYEVDRLVFGPEGDGCGNAGGDDGEIVVEVLVRGGDGPGGRRAVERVLEAWCGRRGGACELNDLESLSSVYSKRTVEEVALDPTKDLSFNLNLTPLQQQSRAQVPLPYAHEGTFPESSTSHRSTSTIFYDPDSADDIDDDDPDEDLDI